MRKLGYDTLIRVIKGVGVKYFGMEFADAITEQKLKSIQIMRKTENNFFILKNPFFFQKLFVDVFFCELEVVYRAVCTYSIYAKDCTVSACLA